MCSSYVLGGGARRSLYLYKGKLSPLAVLSALDELGKQIGIHMPQGDLQQDRHTRPDPTEKGSGDPPRYLVLANLRCCCTLVSALAAAATHTFTHVALVAMRLITLKVSGCCICSTIQDAATQSDARITCVINAHKSSTSALVSKAPLQPSHGSWLPGLTKAARIQEPAQESRQYVGRAVVAACTQHATGQLGWCDQTVQQLRTVQPTITTVQYSHWGQQYSAALASHPRADEGAQRAYSCSPVFQVWCEGNRNDAAADAVYRALLLLLYSPSQPLSLASSKSSL